MHHAAPTHNYTLSLHDALPIFSPRLQTWKPPESVRIGLFHCSKRCRPPNCWSTSRPGRIHRWKVLPRDRKSTRLNSSHGYISYAVFCLKKKRTTTKQGDMDTII